MKADPNSTSAEDTLLVLRRLSETCGSLECAATPTINSVFISNSATSAASGAKLETIDPSNERVIAAFSRGGSEDVDSAAKSAKAALRGAWADCAPQRRGELLYALADRVEKWAEVLARLETIDVGKPLSASRGDVAGAVATIRYNAGAADKLEGITVPLGKGFVDYTEPEPLGVTGHIVPWNFPLGMAVRSVAPALAAGCVAIIKPAEQTPLATLALAALAAEAGFPPGTVNLVTGLGEEAGSALVAHPLVNGITFTGSVETGRLVGESAGRLLKPAVLELGGKNPMIVFDDADIGQAIEAAVEGAFDNCGQVCSSVSRLLLQREIKDEFLSRFAERARRLKIAPGLSDGDLGPLVSREQHRKVASHIRSARSGGATLLAGGEIPCRPGSGYFVRPTIIDNIHPDLELAREETFGPVVCAFGFDAESEAAEIANSLPYGLAAGIFTRNIDAALRLSRKLEAGTVWINGWFIGGVQAPTGGVKDSGYGRERGLEGVRNYLRTKNVGIRLANW